MKHCRLIVVVFFLCFTVCAQAPQTATADDEASHKALRDLRDAATNALNTGNLEALLPLLHKNIVFIPMSGEVCRGHDGVRAYFNRMMTGPGRIVESVHVNPVADRLTDLYGGMTGVSYGSSVDHYKLTNGQEFEVNARWSATLVKENGNWQIASFQLAANLFDNPLLNKAKSGLYWSGGGAGFIGLVLGLLIGRRWGKSAA